MSALTVAVVDSTGAPVPNALVLLNTYSPLDWGQAGITVNPNPRFTGADGTVNFYSGPALAKSIMVQASVVGGGSGTQVSPTPFDGTADLTVTVTVSFKQARPAAVVQPSLGQYDPDDAGGAINRGGMAATGRPPLPPNPTKRFFRGNLMIELVDSHGTPLPVPFVDGGNTTPQNSVMSWFLPKYTRPWQDLIITGHCQRSYSHIHLDVFTALAIGWTYAQFIALVQYLISYGFFVSFWGQGPGTPGGWQSWADAQPNLQPLLDALTAAGPATSERCILLFTKEEDTYASGQALLEIAQHVMPQAKDLGLACYHHFTGRMRSWQLPGETPQQFWAEQIGIGVTGLCYQALCVTPGFSFQDPAGIVPAGTMMAELWDATSVVCPAGGDNVFFEGCATNKLYGTRNERDGNRLGLEAVEALGQWGVSGYGDGGCQLDGSPL